jgi:SAM-dependent methyltransferase
MRPRSELKSASESEHDAVFGSTFARYSTRELDEFIVPFDLRLRSNNLDPAAFFSNALVLDAGCGGGRGSLFALRHGAAFVHSIDVSEQNVATTARVLAQAGFDNFAVHLCSLEHIPFAERTFDVVWCNGVLMHTAIPSATLTEVIRVLKAGGRAWIYVYGAGGVYWRVVAVLRRVLAALTPNALIAALDSAGVPTSRVAEMLDDWKAPFLRTYRDAMLRESFDQLGCSAERLLRGMPYDTSEQLARGISRGFVGEGDLRYLVTRETVTQRALTDALATALNASHLVEKEDLSTIDGGPLERRFAAALATFGERMAGEPEKAIAAAVRTQLLLRDSFLPSPTLESLEAVIATLAGEALPTSAGAPTPALRTSEAP